MSVFPKTNKTKTKATSNFCQLTHLTSEELVLSEKFVREALLSLPVPSNYLLVRDDRHSASALLEAVSPNNLTQD